MPRPTAQKTAKKTTAPARPHEVRIIGGQWKRTRLPVADKPGLRPTPDRVRETLFNWLGQDLTGWRCLDMFAGTGALGLEAASRGAAEVHLFEADAALVAQLVQLKTRLGAAQLQVTRGDGVALTGRLGAASIDLVLLDPPFETTQYPAAVAAALRVLTPAGRLYLEAPELWSAERLAGHGLAVERHLKAGAVHAHLLARA
ncbi:16S rRNA (guanine(966)-N(2))-methyltransferase RsmD [Pseudorhodoferax sp. Leaf265]|jgi:16S rRNA (guanine(966)-N(2))-methyltransferase RsmD|uniref:16S rRNA (guanine(966)-N(2))-methyltransferase RsmD n=1 Tax=Pseudorhodoferax sp. Leaf265 TaxID=1736315 RepID=UPI0006F7A569|nr:16S rRNA (guanine(966)-N(2))-methyltransferase RsmD [Pseudorhodoferax sp. Leaf265]KQP02783.1 16S rRNA (guanine(966)-N(2))-methyltransferase RsmD [Pseudorhodoferax sp. Leaf265]PZP95547.1 MAG: 16S rRNA (guanine(966)-N(2))-methyltransferase RsmD [Variovorax paradoxus]PZQ06415.1 MAG: 16S rRNA (guanine(966)-N(2))-methyltransferase RsmD [Variovorax paradoxus]